MFSYFADNSRKHFGFIPDIIEILYHYELSDYLVEYLLEGSFPPKQLWKSIVYGAVNETHANEWSLRISSDNDFIRFRNIHRSVELANVWKYSKCSRDIQNSFFITKLITDIPNNTEGICVVCNRHFSDIFVRACCSCPSTQALQEAWWDMMIEHFNLDLYVEISQYDNEQRYQILLGKKPLTDIDELDYERLLKLCHYHLIYCIT